MRERNLVPFWGAGLTTPSYPLWNELLNKFAEKHDIHFDAEMHAEQCASHAIRQGGKMNFGAYLRDRFSKPATLSIYRQMIRKFPPTYHLTINYDHSIESQPAAARLKARALHGL